MTSLQTGNGSTAAQYYYDAFGTVTEETAAVNNPFRYAGYEYDGETELYYLKSRMYDSITARFLQEDTYRGQLNDPLSLNLYTYCANNPLTYWDPTGHVYTEWDRANGVNKAKIEAATAAYDRAKANGDKEGMARAHAAAEKERNAVRSSNEAGSASGYTYVVNKNGFASLNRYDAAAPTIINSGGSATLNGSSYIPERNREASKIIAENINSMLPAFMPVKSSSAVQGPVSGSGRLYASLTSDIAYSFEDGLDNFKRNIANGISIMSDFAAGFDFGVTESVTYGTSKSLEVYYDPEHEVAYLVGKVAGDAVTLIVSAKGAIASGGAAAATAPSGVGAVAFGTSAVYCGTVTASSSSNLAASVSQLIYFASNGSKPGSEEKNVGMGDFKYVEGAGSKANGMLGKNGTQVTSKTVWQNGKTERIDVENPNPGQRSGNIHYHDANNNMYRFDPSVQKFYDETGNLAPNKVQNLLKNKDFQKNIDKGLGILGEAPLYKK